MLVEAKVFNVGARLFGMVMWGEFLVFLGFDCLGKIVGAKVVMGGDWVGCRGGCGGGVSRFFCLFGAWLFGEDDGWESGDTGGGWGVGVSVVEVVSNVGMSVEVVVQVKEMLLWVMLVWLVEELDRGIVTESIGFSDSSGKIPLTVSHSCLMPAMSF